MSDSSEALIGRARRWRALWLPPLSTLLLLALFNLLLSNFYQMSLYPSGYLSEMLACTLLAWWLYLLLRPWGLFLAVQALALGLLYLGNAYKMQYFAAPVLPADLTALPVLFEQISGWRFVLMAMPFALLLLLALAGLRWRRRTPVLLFGGLLLVYGVLRLMPAEIASGMDRFYGYTPFGQIYNFYERGPHLFLLNEYARARAVAGRVPGREEVAAALRDVPLPAPLPRPAAEGPPRDVYVFMMETLWDASLLKAEHFDHDPFAPAFRALYEQSGRSQALVPVFGGGTANSEFEALCGMPAFDDAIVFVTGLDRPALCLPRILAQAGYHTYAVTPDAFGVWNRGHVFRHVGFQRFYDGDNFDPDDRNGGFMADQALFEQWEALAAKQPAPGPAFTYIATVSGHYPFELDARKRPSRIHGSSKDRLIDGYADSVYYDTAELAAYIQRLRARDPDALIVAFGDHLPVLGDGFAPFHRSGLTGLREEEFTPAMLEVHQSTPLLVIDGRNGPLKLGHLSLYELPRLLLGLLHVQGPTELDVFTPPPGLHPRMRNGRLLVVPDRGTPGFCAPDTRSETCRQVNRWHADMQVFRTDLVGGAGYTTAMLYGDPERALDIPSLGLSYLSDANPSQPCDIQVTEWEPRSTRWGHGFNPQQDGSPVFHIRYRGGARRVHAWLGFEELRIEDKGNDMLDAVMTGRLPLFLPGDHVLRLSCNGDAHRIEVGRFHVGL
ncbi:MAG TPA: LTA synthase family protein [Gammaproteobacteria bacterium]|nr:LTA synthase family protein [Gammaproteobacteria bacterium]